MATSKHAETDTATHRTCSSCSTPKPFAFYAPSKTGYAGFESRCRDCSKSAARSSRLMSMYGITEDDYQRMFESQGGRCFVCGFRPKTIPLAVDHDHKTGLVRGLLCSKGGVGCNGTLGMFKDNVEIFRRFVEYLETPPAPEAMGREHRLTDEQEQRHKRGRRSRVTRR